MKMLKAGSLTSKTLICLGVFLFSLAAVGDVTAQVRCRATVSYQWKPSAGEETSELKEVFYTSVERMGADEARVKGEVEQLTLLERTRAKERCEVEHQNVAGCISRKHTSMSSVIERLSFTARKALEEAI